MKIAFIDLEGTLIELGNWSKVAHEFGAKKVSDEFFKLYEEGRVGYEEWRRELVKVWRKSKITKQQFIDVLKDYKSFSGAKKLINGLKKKGFKTIMITGAISTLAELVQKDLGIDEIYSANVFVFDKQGNFQDIKTHEEYRRGQGKVHFIKEIISKEGVDKKDCIAIGGDDINDYWMMKELESFAVKPKLRQIQEVVGHNVDSLVDILEFV